MVGGKKPSECWQEQYQGTAFLSGLIFSPLLIFFCQQLHAFLLAALLADSF
jgi:hypothetical protein